MNDNLRINKNNFDFIRLVLAFTVMCHHISALVPNVVYKQVSILFSSQTAIRAFFVISGFLVAKSLLNSSSLKSYISKRIRRIVPAYTFVIIFFAVLLSLFSTLNIKEYFSANQFWTYLGVNLLYQNYLEPCLPGLFDSQNINCAVNGSLWTIKIEESFYLVLPILVFIQERFFKNKLFFYLLIYIISILFFNILVQNGYYRIAKQLPGTLCYFITGILCFHYFKWLLGKLNYLIIPALMLFIWEVNYLDFLLISPISLAIIILFIAYNFSFLNNFGRYGDYTYGVYIFHYPIIQLFVWIGLHQTLNKWVLFLLIVFVTFIFAIFSWKCIETRFISRNYINRIKNIDN